MGKVVKSYKVDSLSKVNTSRYVEGDLFITNQSVGILINGRIRTMSTSTPNLKNYVRKEDVQEMIDETLKKVKKVE